MICKHDEATRIRIEAAYDGAPDLQYSGVNVNGFAEESCARGLDPRYVAREMPRDLVRAAFWCKACGALGVMAPSGEHWLHPRPEAQ